MIKKILVNTDSIYQNSNVNEFHKIASMRSSFTFKLYEKVYLTSRFF